MKTVIGIPGWYSNIMFGVNESYLRFLKQFGDVVILRPDDPIRELSLLVLPGGADINPASYNMPPSIDTNTPNLCLEYFDNIVLPRYQELLIPIVGICRGAQRLWTNYKGELVQHYVGHSQSEYNTDLAHKLIFNDKYSEMKSLVKKVTSRHHQMMYGSPDNITVVATAPCDKNVEIFKCNDYPAWGVQFHPEDQHDGIFNWILEDLEVK